MQTTAGAVDPAQITLTRYEAHHLPYWDVHYKDTYAGNVGYQTGGLYHPYFNNSVDLPVCRCLEEAAMLVAEAFASYLEDISHNPVASPKLKSFAQQCLSAA